MGWRYGTESLGPPEEIRRFVIAAIEATNPWFELQKKVAGKKEDHNGTESG